MYEQKFYTSIEQSKKLLELGLSPESADCMWEQHDNESPYVTVKPYTTLGRSIGAHAIPCWSIGALLNIMPKLYEFKEDPEDGGCQPNLCKGWDNNLWHVVYRTSIYVTEWYENPIDACFEMVCWLLRKGYIKKNSHDG